MNFTLAYLKLQILTGIWLIDEKAVYGYGTQLSNFLKSETIDGEKEPVQCEVFSLSPIGQIIKSENIQSLLDSSPEGSTAIIPINGSLMKYDYCGAPGMQTIGERINLADNHKNIDSIVLKIDSPGGTVDGTQALANIIKGTNKPIVALADGLMASAAYWIASAADKIIADNETAQIGSIGAMISFADVRPAYEKEGIKFHDINADQSKDKNSIFMKALEGDYKPIKDELLNVAAQEFIDNVKANRGDIINETKSQPVYTGKVYFAKDALKLGLIDEIGDVNSAVKIVKNIVNENNSNNLKNIDMKISVKESFKSLLSFLGMEKAGEIELTEEKVGEIDAELTSLKTQVETVTIEKTDLQVKLDEQIAETAKVQKAFDDFKASDAVIETISTKDKDKINSKKTSDFSEMSHNKIADNIAG